MRRHRVRLNAPRRFAAVTGYDDATRKSKMKTPQEWQDELAGETSLQSIAAIQADALVEAAKIVRDKLSWVAEEQHFFSNIGALEAHTEIIKRAAAHHNEKGQPQPPRS